MRTLSSSSSKALPCKMLIPQINISLGSVVLDFLHYVEFSKSVDTLTDAGYLELPKNLIIRNGNQIVTEIVNGTDPLFKRGDTIQVELGYAPNLNTYFEGFVSQISPTFPLRFEIEDSMYDLKNQAVDPLNLKSTTLANLLSLVLPSTVTFQALDVNLGNFRIKDRSSVGEVLAFLKKNYGFSAYFKADGTLNVGLAFPDPPNLATPHVFEYSKNIIDDTSLVYKKAEDQLLKITAVSIFPDNTKIEIEVGDTAGEQRTIFQYNMVEADLRTVANEQLSRLKYEGFEGSFTTFLEPKVEPGEAVQIIHPFFNEKEGVYQTKAVTTSMGPDGGRQIIELETRLS